MKRFCAWLLVVGFMALAFIGEALATSTVWDSANTSVTTAVTNVSSLLMVAVGIPLAFLAFNIIKSVVTKARG